MTTKVIDARHLFPNAVLPLAICNHCGHRLNAIPDGCNIAQIACYCGAIGQFVDPQ